MTTASIIICTRNSANHLHGTLKAMGHLKIPSDISCELIIVDNGSTDNTVKMVQSSDLPNMSIRYIYEAQIGKSRGLNAALRATNSTILLFTDDDVRPIGNWIQSLCAPIISCEADAVTGDVRLAPYLERPWMSSLHRVWLSALEPTEVQRDLEPVSDMRGGNMAFSRRVLEDVPEFDTELGPGGLGLGDDTLFTLRLKAARYRIVYSKHAFVEHHLDESRLSRSAFLDLAEKRGRSAGYIAYHWEHRSILAPMLRLAWRTVLLKYWRMHQKGEYSFQEGMPTWEMQALWSIYFYKQFLIEQRELPKYALL